MISILIPVYNYNVIPLVDHLLKQIDASGIRAEILVIDDGSEPQWKQKNRVLHSYSDPVLYYKEMVHNSGRSSIRNYLAGQASYEYLLFLDCDVLPESASFIQRYYDNLTKAPLLCGGLSYDKTPPQDDALKLHWLYGQNREVRSLASRQKEPYRTFLTSNFLIQKSVFQSLQFDENIKGYGHEDTLFGLKCASRQVQIHHFDNPVRHLGLDPVDEFLKKRLQAVSDLNQLKAQVQNADMLKKNIRILSTEKKLRKYGLAGLVFTILKIMEPFFIFNLKGSTPNLKYFDLIRLKHLLDK